MFLGTIPRPVRSILLEHSREWKATSAYVGCSGNFTVERVLGTENRFELHGCDVTLYTCVLGLLQAGRKLRIRIKPEAQEEWGWLAESMKSAVDQAATVMLCTRMLAGIHRTEPYFERLRVSHRRRWTSLHADTVRRIEAKRVKLASFTPADAVEWMDAVPRDQAAVSFPPFYDGGYETMFGDLDAVFAWSAPDYPLMDDARKALFIERLTDRREWFLGVNFELEGREACFRGYVKPSPRAMPILVYSSHGKARVMLPRQRVEPVKNVHLGPGDELGERLALAPLSVPQFASLRSTFLNPRIAPSSALTAFAVLVDGKLVGAFAVQAPDDGRYANVPSGLPTPQGYLLSDFPVRPTRYRHLSKLVLMAALSREGQLVIERASRARVRALTTTAFTNRAVSMKYRGLFKLLSRKEGEFEDGFRYQLQYGAPMGALTLGEAMAAWRERYGDVAT